MIVDGEQITVSTTAVGFTKTKIKPSNDRPMYRAFVHVNSGNIRARWDGTDPTATTGALYGAGGEIVLVGLSELNNFKAISADGAAAEIFVHYGRGGSDV